MGIVVHHALANWIGNNRKYFKLSKLSEKQIKALTSLDFNFELKKL